MSSRWIDNRLPLLIGLACLVFMLLAAPAHAAYPLKWQRVAEVDAVAVAVKAVTAAELAALQLEHARGIDRSALGRTVPKHRDGFAILYRDTTTGAYRCEVFVRDPEDATTLEHELRHCNGWVH